MTTKRKKKRGKKKIGKISASFVDVYKPRHRGNLTTRNPGETLSVIFPRVYYHL